MSVLQKLLDQPETLIEFESDPEIAGGSRVKGVEPLSQNALNSLQEFVSFCKDSELICRPIFPSCFIDGIYKKDGIYYEVDCVWSDAKENNCITVIRVSREHADQKIRKVKEFEEALIEPDFLSIYAFQDFYPSDDPSNWVDVMINKHFTAIYKRPGDEEDLNSQGNYYRRKSIHNDVWKTIDRMRSEKVNFNDVREFQSDHFKINVLVKSRSNVN